MSGFPLPFPMEPSLVAGCGGGYDVVCALPVALALHQAGQPFCLTSYSFSELKQVQGAEALDPLCLRVDRHCQPPPEGYCPEIHLCRWWYETFQEDISVYCYRKVGVRPLAERLAELCRRHALRAVVIVDAGVDGLFHGDEFELGTPETDTASLLAGYLQDGLRRICAFTAFGTEGTGYAVRHADALQRMSELIARGGCLGVSALLPQNSIGQWFQSCVDFIHEQMGPQWTSHMAASLVAALRGKFGEQTLSERCLTHPIWVSPLTQLYWFFDLETLAQARPYLKQALESDSLGQLHDLIQDYRHQQPPRARLDIPI